jgi:hypothetical protein
MRGKNNRFIKWLIYGLTGFGIVLFLFIVLASIFFEKKINNRTIIFLLGAGAFLASLSSIHLAVLKIRTWIIVDALCVDRQLNKIMSPNQDMSGWVLTWRLKCVFTHDGEKYEVYPKVGWITVGFKDEKSAKEYLSRKISPNNECKLRINPSNFQEAELLRSKTFFGIFVT